MTTTLADLTDAERDAEIGRRLHLKGINPCVCGLACDAYRMHWDRTLNGGQTKSQSRAGQASMATLGYHKDGTSRRAAQMALRRHHTANAASR